MVHYRPDNISIRNPCLPIPSNPAHPAPHIASMARRTTLPRTNSDTDNISQCISPAVLVRVLRLRSWRLVILLIFIAVVYLQTAGAIGKGRYARARGGTLFWAIVFIIPTFAVLVSPTIFYPTILLLLPAFFFLMAYGRLGEVVAKYGPVAVLGEAVPGVGVAPTPPPPALGVPVPGVPGPVAMGGPMMPPPVPAAPMPAYQAPGPRVPQCPTCGRDLYYAANHRRWYCQTCDAGGRP